MNQRPRYPLPSIGEFLFITIALCLSFSPWSKGLLNDGDTGYHIRAGEYILDTMSVPRHDIFSYLSPPLPWTAHEWLSEVVMGSLHRLSGLTGVVIFFIFLISLTYTLLYQFMRENKGNVFVDLFIFLLVIMSSQIHWLARPHIFSLFIFVIWYRLLDVYQNEHQNYLFFLPPIMILWVNLHGGFISGFVLLGIYTLGNAITYYISHDTDKKLVIRKIKHLGMVSLACLLASLINPYTYNILIFPFKLVSNKMIMNNVNEFLSPNFHNYMPFKYLLLFVIAVLALSRKELNAIELISILLFTSMALYSVRHILLFAIIVAPIMSRQSMGLISSVENRSFLNKFRKKSNDLSVIEERSYGYYWAILTVFIIVGSASMGKISFRFDAEKKPVAAVEFLKTINLKGNMYNNDEFGDYLIYAAYPEYRVFFDGRSDMYGSEILKDYQKVAGFQAGWEEVMEKYEIRWVFFPSNSTLSNALSQREDWKLVYTDNVANIFLRKIPMYENLIKDYGNLTASFY